MSLLENSCLESAIIAAVQNLYTRDVNTIFYVNKELYNNTKDCRRYTYYPNGNKKRMINYKIENNKFIKHGLFRTWYNNGQLKGESTYENGELKIVRIWNEDGNLHLEDNFLIGLVRYYYENGQLWEESNYKLTSHGKQQHGLFRKWHYNGQLFCESTYEHDILHGLDSQWYPNGQLWKECTWEHGKPHGLGRQWYHNGQLCIECTYDENGKKHGVFCEWHDDGQLKSEITYEHGELHGLYRWWDSDGELQFKHIWEHGKIIE